MPNRGLPVVVIGSGAAGLFTALQAAPVLPVLVLTRAGAAEANTAWAQGGIAAALGHGDSPRSHLEDTVAAGAGLVDEAAARVLCDEGPARIRELAALGTPFDLSGGTFALGREAAHSANRIVHAGGDRTGARLEQALLAAARAAGVTIQDMSEVTGIIVEHGRARGVRIRTVAGAERAIEARAVVIATGGAGQLYSHTTNPAVARGEGLALAFDAGAELADLEFYQFHPTALRFPACGRSSFRKPSAARAPSFATPPASGSCRATIRSPTSRHATSSRAPSSAKCSATAPTTWCSTAPKSPRAWTSSRASLPSRRFVANWASTSARRPSP